MKKWFNKERQLGTSSIIPETPYQQAKQEWDNRIGSARVQAKNWRFTAVLSMIIALASLVLLMVNLATTKNVVYIAQVADSGRVVNVSPLTVPYEPNVAQKEYFVTHFVKLVREIPLDPVVAKSHWTEAYNFLTQRTSSELNTYFSQQNPVQLLGKQTVTVNVTDINPVSDDTYQVDWEEAVVGSDGKAEPVKMFSGVFTLMIKQPSTQKMILKNPLGIYITDFHISSREK